MSAMNPWTEKSYKKRRCKLYVLGNNAQHSTVTDLSHLLLAAFEQCLCVVSIVARQSNPQGCF